MIDHQRIGFDALFLEQPKTGAGRYATNLWKQLNELLEPSQLALLAPSDAADPVLSAAQDDQLMTASTPPIGGRARKLWWEQIGLPRAVCACVPPLDLVHIPYFAAPVIKSARYVVTIHDLIPIVVPEYAGSRSMRSYMRLVTETARRARLILTDSEYSRQEIVRVLKIPAGQVRAIPLAADDQFSPISSERDREDVQAVLKSHGIREPYIVNTGGLDVRKNVAAVIEGFALAQGATSGDHDLVIVGRAHTDNSRMYPPLDRLVRRLGLTERVKFVGAVDDDEFVALYRGAEFFVYASTYEGFGLTPLEAMACGTPVVSSGATSLAEVVGDAGLIVDPTPRGIAAGIVALANDPDRRAELAARGLARARGYSWRTTAEMTLEAYDDALRGALV